MARRRRDDRGSTLVEAAFVMPVFILMIFGIFEFSGMVMARTGSGAAVKGGARMAVVAGSDAMADQRILLRMAKDGSGVSQDTVTRVVIWKASAAGESPPGNCLSSAVSLTSDLCNVYVDPQGVGGAFTRAKLPMTPDGQVPTPANADYYFGCDTSTGPGALDAPHKLDCGWEPHSRRIITQSPAYTCQGANDPKCRPTDLIGIYIQVDHKFYTGFFGSNALYSNKTISAIEPQGYDK
jgi:hypothetical protein